MYDGKGESQLDRGPMHHQRIGVPVVDALYLVSTMDIQSSFPLIDFTSSNTLLTVHGPHSW